MKEPVATGDSPISGAAPRPVTDGRITNFVALHRLPWELAMAALTVVYVVLAFLQDQGNPGVTAGVEGLAVVFVAEFALRLYDAPSRVEYFRRHWIDIVTCIPVIGTLRFLRLFRLLAFVRLGAIVRAFGVGAATNDRIAGGVGLWVLAPTLLVVWLAASYGYYELEGGVNPHIHSFTDALYFSLVTASTVGYGDVTPVTPEGKVLTGLLIFIGIGLLGFASAQLTTKLLPQRDSIAELSATIQRQGELISQLCERLDDMTAAISNASHLAEEDLPTPPGRPRRYGC